MQVLFKLKCFFPKFDTKGTQFFFLIIRGSNAELEKKNDSIFKRLATLEE